MKLNIRTGVYSMSFYTKIKRRYDGGIGIFKATGQWADGHLAYSRYDEDGNVIEDEEGAYAQVRDGNGLYMVRV